MDKKHVAASGAQKGQYVNCSAKNCRVSSEQDHVDYNTLHTVKGWVERDGTKKLVKEITEQDVKSFRALPKAKQQEARDAYKKSQAEKVERARKKRDGMMTPEKMNQMRERMLEMEAKSKQPKVVKPTPPQTFTTDDGFEVAKRTYSKQEVNAVNTVISEYSTLLLDGDSSAEEVEKTIKTREYLTPQDKAKLLVPLKLIKDNDYKASNLERRLYANMLTHFKSDMEIGVDLGSHTGWWLHKKDLEDKPKAPRKPKKPADVSPDKAEKKSLKNKISDFFSK